MSGQKDCLTTQELSAPSYPSAKTIHAGRALGGAVVYTARRPDTLPA